MSGYPTGRRQRATASSVAPTKTQVFNLTEQLVVAEADAMLAACKAHPQGQFFAQPAERQRLIQYALDRVNKVYLLVQHPHLVQRQYEPAIAQKPAIRQALREGMQEMAQVYRRSRQRLYTRHDMGVTGFEANLTPVR